MTKPVFFDSSGKRQKWAKRSSIALLLLLVSIVAVFAITIAAVPDGDNLPLQLPGGHPAPVKSGWTSLNQKLRSWLPHGSARPVAGKPLTLGFYVPWDEASASSLRAHADELDWVAPALISVTGADHRIVVQEDQRFDKIIADAPKAPKVLPMVQNIVNGVWDKEATAALLRDPVARRDLAQRIAALVAQKGYAGAIMDFENLPDASIPNYITLLRDVNAALPHGNVVAVTVAAGAPAWQLQQFAHASDQVILMDYDQHTEPNQPGPIAAQPWFVNELRTAVSAVGRSKLIVAIGSYGYDWHDNSADAMNISEAWLAAHDSEAQIQFDKASGNAAFAYDENGSHHEIWMMDAATSWNQLKAVRAMGLGSVALWRLGGEDVGVWPAIASFRTGATSLPDLSILHNGSNVDVEGSGEILRITATPVQGSRTLDFNKAGLIQNETYTKLPTPYVVSRTGSSNPKQIALTFDDGPDPTWTPKILDILKAEHVPATFFIVGENALEEPELLSRIVAEGHTIGNHTYTHPNLAMDGERTTSIELNATQRLVEAYTGRGMRLFRAPYFGDAEPTTADELGPALVAQKQGYTVVGLHVDAEDWQRPGTDAIVNTTLNEVLNAEPDRSANIVLLHDGGGDRAQTVAALPRIIEGLRAKGYSFVPVSQLAGLSRDAVMPKVSGADLMAVRADVGIFLLLAGLAKMLKWIFFIAITLGIARALMLATLAIRQRLRERHLVAPVYTPTVSVIIPAYNEAKVIESSVRRVLASDYPAIQLIVADDGSKDMTSDMVASAFGEDPRVTLLTLQNGGKASALNRALQSATGEIIIALDADTQFEATTIRRLARWFADETLGAVAGNAKVGNRVNLVTRWQAIEYITAQNLERRALAQFGAITVVPGAVGAWRRTALDAVGGYPEDTLAEDQDLTIAIQQAGWKVTYDPDAVAWTEAPESFKALAKQRYRWAFGTLQCLWKYRGLRRSKAAPGLAWIGLPQAWLFQIGFAAISPLIDLALLVALAGTGIAIWQHGWDQTRGDVGVMALYWVAFTAIDIGCGWVAYRLDKKRVRYPAFLLVAQRFVYRQLMYWVVLRAISAAVGGLWVGWGKLERTGSVDAGAAPSEPEKKLPLAA